MTADIDRSVAVSHVMSLTEARCNRHDRYDHTLLIYLGLLSLSTTRIESSVLIGLKFFFCEFSVTFRVIVKATISQFLSDRYKQRFAIRDRCPVCNVGVLWPNGWMDQDATWHGGRLRPRPHCVRW